MNKAPKVNMMLAVGKNGQLGLNGGLPDWDAGKDMLRFKYMTMNKVLIVGKRTLDSLPKKMLGRDIVYLTTNRESEVPAIACNSITKTSCKEEALMVAKKFNKEIVIIGGLSIYEQFLMTGLVEYIYLTRVNYEGPADVNYRTDFPEYAPIMSEKDKLGNEFTILKRDSYRLERIRA